MPANSEETTKKVYGMGFVNSPYVCSEDTDWKAVFKQDDEEESSGEQDNG